MQVVEPAVDSRERLAPIRSALGGGERERARVLLHAALQGLEEPRPGEEAAHISFLLELDPLAQELSSHGDSLRLWEAVLGLRARLLPPDHVDLLNAKLSLAQLERTGGDLVAARELFEAVLAARAALPLDHLILVRAKGGLAWTVYRQGDLGAARDLFREAVEEATGSLGAEDPVTLSARQGLAAAIGDLGDLAGERAIEEELIALRTSCSHPRIPRSPT
jgi:hypothetical protein